MWSVDLNEIETLNKGFSANNTCEQKHLIESETALSPAEHFVEYFLNKKIFFVVLFVKSNAQSIFNKKDPTSKDKINNKELKI